MLMFFGRDEKKDTQKRAETVPLLPLRDIIVFPHMVVPLFVGREKSIAALNYAMAHKGADEKAIIVLAAQKKAKTNEPTPDDIFHFGTIGNVIQLLPLPDGTVKVLVEGIRRAKIRRFLPSDPFFMVEAEDVPESTEKTVELAALIRTVHSVFEAFVKLNKRIPPEMLMQVATIEEPARLGDTIVAHLSLKLNDKQSLLETESPVKRLEKLYELMQGEIEILQVEKKIRTRVKKQMEKTQKEYYLNEQMQAIQKELGERDEFKNEIQEIDEKLKTKRMSKEATLKVKKELKKLRMMSPMSAEATVVRNYIDWILSLPWYDETKDRLDVIEAERVLNEDHYGLKKAKERILEYLAVQALVQKLKGPILCFVGPPGVGKTSLARSIARALGRKFHRISLGGMRDEAEIRGHRRTYIGALPGQILQGLRRAETKNPVFILDEVDKLGTDFRGDPSSALLEVLDPEQNSTFRDHYLDVPFDLSEVLFITTANILDPVPAPLKDRMEVLEIAGYTEEEKLKIATDHLVEKQVKNNGMTAAYIRFTPETLRQVIRGYTREAGVRNLEREIGALCRKVARRRAEGNETPIEISPAVVVEMLGAPKFLDEEMEERTKDPGVAIGLAWTPAGGEVLFIEASRMAGTGSLTLTGQLGEVMKESARAALSWLRTHSKEYGIDPDFFKNAEMHVHVPSGAIPKDGPSAGVTMAAAMASELTGRPVRGDVAMTGEITLSGRVLPVGGIKEKVLAARRVGIHEVILPKQNAKNINEDLTPELRNDLTVHLVSTIDEVLALALQPVASDARPAADGKRKRDEGRSDVKNEGKGGRGYTPPPS